MQSAEARGRQALALVGDWGARLEGLPLERERDALRNDVADLLLLLAQTRARQARDAEGGKAVLALLGQAADLRAPSASHYRLRAQANRLVGEKKQADEDQRRAEGPKTPRRAVDHYLLGMSFQAEADRAGGADSEEEAGKAAREKRIKQAIEQYRAALRLETNHYWANLQLGSSLLALGQPAEAAEALNACVALDSKAPWGYVVRGLARVAQKQFADATADMNRAIALSPEFRLPRLNRGVAYWLQGKHKEALADFNAVLQPPQGQRLIEGAYYKGQMHMAREEFKEALAAFDEVVAARRSYRSLHLSRARCLMALGDQKKALAALDLFLDDGKGFDTKSTEAAGQRGRLLRVVLVPKLQPAARRQALLLAHAQLSEAAKGGTGSAAVLEDLGAIQEQMGQTAQAVASYTAALKLAPKNVKLLVKRGWARADLKPPRYDDARDDFEEALRLDPTHAEAYAGLGYAQACREKPAEARRAAGRALLHGAGDYVVLHNVACVYAKLAQADKMQARECEDIALDLLRREVELWRKGGKGPSALQLIRAEPSFHKELRDRPEFRKLLGDEA
jgi:tetratricopeptide (TPR) repeat protein